MQPREMHDRRTDVEVLDVRRDDEWAAGHIEGARHIPLDELPARLDELDRDRPVVTVCGGGGRAGKAAEQLTGAGLSAQVLEGGMRGWERDGLPVRAADGGAGRVT